MRMEPTVKNRKLEFETDGIQRLSLLFRAVDHPTRLAIVQLIHNHDTMSVMEYGYACYKKGIGSLDKGYEAGSMIRSNSNHFLISLA